jgi:peptidoglycan LD-endopeptidase CwlK
MPFTLTERDRRRLQGVHPDLVRVIERAAATTSINFTIIQGLRTMAEQRKLVSIGASRTLRSRHLTGHAVDIAPIVDLDRDGKVETTEMFHWPLINKLSLYIKRAAKDVGVPVEWGGSWVSFRDGPHWQLPWKDYP